MQAKLLAVEVRRRLRVAIPELYKELRWRDELIESQEEELDQLRSETEG